MKDYSEDIAAVEKLANAGKDDPIEAASLRSLARLVTVLFGTARIWNYQVADQSGRDAVEKMARDQMDRTNILVPHVSISSWQFVHTRDGVVVYDPVKDAPPPKDPVAAHVEKQMRKRYADLTFDIIRDMASAGITAIYTTEEEMDLLWARAISGNYKSADELVRMNCPGIGLYDRRNNDLVAGREALIGTQILDPGSSRDRRDIMAELAKKFGAKYAGFRRDGADPAVAGPVGFGADPASGPDKTFVTERFKCRSCGKSSDHEIKPWLPRSVIDKIESICGDCYRKIQKTLSDSIARPGLIVGGHSKTAAKAAMEKTGLPKELHGHKVVVKDGKSDVPEFGKFEDLWAMDGNAERIVAERLAKVDGAEKPTHDSGEPSEGDAMLDFFKGK